jgi:hypothetical protein
MSDDMPRPDQSEIDGEPPKRPNLAERDAKLSAVLDQDPSFESVRPLMEPPLEITRSMLSLLNMRDETVIVYEPSVPGHGHAPKQHAPREGSSL